MTPHCDYCAVPYRAVLIELSRQGQRASVICRHYGLRVSTVVTMLKEARKRECLPHPTCRYCSVRIPPQRIVCGKRGCHSALDRDNMRLRRARFGHRRKPRAKQNGGHKERTDFVWPELPPNPKERNPRAPRPVIGAPIVHVASLLGVGNKCAPVRRAAIAEYEAEIQRRIPPTPPAPPPPPPAPVERVHKAVSYVVAPPLCPTIGTLVDPRWRKVARKEAA